MKNGLIKVSFNFILFIVCLAILVMFYTPSLLRGYIRIGIGNCQKIPIFCIVPERAINVRVLDKGFKSGLVTYEFPQMKISAPRGFNVVQEMIKKYYYKRKKPSEVNSIVYALYQPPGYFTNLFPQIHSGQTKDNYDFIRGLEYARLNEIKNLRDTFFIILKGIFTPDLGDQSKVKMIEFYLPDRKGFINYNLTGSFNYFDCNVVDKKGNFFKVYIQDKKSDLTLDKVFAIISTLKAKG